MSYTKLFTSIVTSSVWGEKDSTRIVWITLLALADKNGEVQASTPGLARVACVSLEDCEIAIGVLLAPDKYSRTKDDEGRRLEEIDGGWHIVNHEKYRNMGSKEDQVSKNAERQARFRDKQARNVTVTESNAGVTPRNAEVTPDRYIAEAEAEAKKEEKIYAQPQKILEKENIALVFSFWKETLGYPLTKLSPERESKIRARLREGYTPGQLKQAITGCSKSAYHMGQNDDKRKYNSVELIFRNSSKTDQFIEMAGAGELPDKEKEEKYLAYNDERNKFFDQFQKKDEQK